MKYTTDVSDVVDNFIAEQHANTEMTKRAIERDIAVHEFCAALRVMGGKDEDPVLTKAIESEEAQKLKTQEKVALLAKRMTVDPPDVSEQTAKILTEHLGSLEAAYRQHEVNLDIATELEDAEDMERQAVAMIQIEKSHDLVMAELVALDAPVAEMVQRVKEPKVK